MYYCSEGRRECCCKSLQAEGTHTQCFRSPAIIENHQTPPPHQISIPPLRCKAIITCSFIMAVDLHTGDTTALPSQFLPDKDDDVLSDTDKNNSNNHGSALKPPVHSTKVHKDDHKDDDFIAELTHHMAHFMLQDDHDTLHFSAIGSQTQSLELSWDLAGSPQSTLWSPVGCNQGSSEGSSQEPSPPATPGSGQQDSCSWKTTYGVVGMFENMKLNERGNSKYHPGYEINQSSKSSSIGLCSYQSLIQDQIRAIELSRLKQEQVLSPKQKPAAAYRKGQGQIISQQQYSEPKQKIQQFQMKGKGGGGGNGQRTRPPRPIITPQAGSGMRALFLGGSGSRGGTGVFLPRGAPSESTNRQGKGCSTVLIPARVVQALQLHFDKTASMSGPKVVGFPPLHDLLVSNRDGMYSLQKRQSTKAPAEVRNEMILPREWTY